MFSRTPSTVRSVQEERSYSIDPCSHANSVNLSFNTGDEAPRLNDALEAILTTFATDSLTKEPGLNRDPWFDNIPRSYWVAVCKQTLAKNPNGDRIAPILQDVVDQITKDF